MIICAKDIMLTMLLCLEVRILSIITAIFQAIGQALTFILPISESGHSAIFHDFASRYSGASSELTGLIHIGIAIGILIAFYKVFLRLFVEFFNTGKEIFTKNFNLKKSTNSRKFMYYTLIAYIPMLFYFIPAGKKGNVFQMLDFLSHDENLLCEGIGFLICAVLLLLAYFTLQKKQKGNQLSLPVAILLSFILFMAIPVPGLSLSAMLISAAVICGINKNISFRYFISVSVPVLLVKGIIEIVTCVTYVNILTGVIGVVIAAVCAFFVSKFLKVIISNMYLKYFSYYNFAVGTIAAVIGIVQLILI